MKGVEDSTEYTQISDRGVKLRGKALAGKRIAVGVCGGIGAVEIVKIIREIRRYGAEVFPYMTSSAESFITPLSVAWAADRKVVKDPESEAAHLEPFHAVLLAPLTLNTLSKISLGISDNAVSLLVASHLTGETVLMAVPTMNQKLHRHPLYEEYRSRLSKWGFRFLESEEEEERLKMPPPEKVASFVIECLGKGST